MKDSEHSEIGKQIGYISISLNNLEFCIIEGINIILEDTSNAVIEMLLEKKSFYEKEKLLKRLYKPIKLSDSLIKSLDEHHLKIDELRKVRNKYIHGFIHRQSINDEMQNGWFVSQINGMGNSEKISLQALEKLSEEFYQAVQVHTYLNQQLSEEIKKSKQELRELKLDPNFFIEDASDEAQGL